jgi:hypothetical protein
MKPNDTRNDTAFAEAARNTLDAAVLSGDIVERLRAARRAAVDAADAQVIALPSRWLPIGAMAATVLAAVLLRGPQPDSMLPLDDEAQLAAVQDLDLLENLEFVAWMVESDGGDPI